LSIAAPTVTAPPKPAVAVWPITISIMLATVMNSLDTTIANVALPHMQGSVSASAEQITWVLTSYIVATAIMTPLTGWLSGKIGRKLLFLVSIAGFTAASMLCGIANSLVELVLFRLLQGVFGASLIPLSQAVLLDTYPREKHGQAMAIWGAGAILGPILGPALGGWLTDNLSWNWVFFINLPVGILAFMGVWLFIGENKHDNPKKFDFFGFGTLIVFIAAFQLMLDRGSNQDWFDSKEIWAEAIIGAIAIYLFLAHTLTAKNPFFDRALSRDRNFVVATIFGFALGILLFATLALLPPMLEVLMNYPVVTTGLVTMPRGLGSFVAMFVVGRLIGRVDTRAILLVGLGLNAISLYQMTHFSLEMDSWPIIISGIIQGFGIGLIFVPLSTLAFATLEPKFRAEGSAVYNLVRNLGSAAGISMLVAQQTKNVEVVHSTLASHVSADNPLVAALPAAMNPSTLAGAVALNGEITRQATMVAYVDDFKLLLWLNFAAVPLLLLLRKPKQMAKPDPAHAVAD
jgi:DHA2 family multidrug resistance protein